MRAKQSNILAFHQGARPSRRPPVGRAMINDTCAGVLALAAKMALIKEQALMADQSAGPQQTAAASEDVQLIATKIQRLLERPLLLVAVGCFVDSMLERLDGSA